MTFDLELAPKGRANQEVDREDPTPIKKPSQTSYVGHTPYIGKPSFVQIYPKT